jgi:hypothetical protein
MVVGFAVATDGLASCSFWFQNVRSGKTNGNHKIISENVESM